MWKYENETDRIVKMIYPDAEKFENQRKGSAADYLVSGSRCLEVKYDNFAATSGNVFIEYATSYNGKIEESGISLAGKRNYHVMYIIPCKDGVRIFEMEAKTLLDMGNRLGKKVQTQPKKNGNRAGFFGLGFVLSIANIKQYELLPSGVL